MSCWQLPFFSLPGGVMLMLGLILWWWIYIDWKQSKTMLKAEKELLKRRYVSFFIASLFLFMVPVITLLYPLIFSGSLLLCLASEIFQ